MTDLIITAVLGAMAGAAVTACLAHVVIREAVAAQARKDILLMREIHPALGQSIVGQRIAPLAKTDFITDPVKAEEAYLQ